MANLFPIVRPAASGNARNLAEADVLLLGALDRSTAGNLQVGTATATTLTMGSAACALDIDGSTVAINAAGTLDIASVGNLEINSNGTAIFHGAGVTIISDGGALNITGDGTADMNIKNVGAEIDIDADILTIDTTAGITMDADHEISLDAKWASNFSVTGANLTLSTLTSGTLILDAVALLDINANTLAIDVAAGMSIDAAAASNVSVTGANLTLSTLTSGTLILDAVALLDINANVLDIDVANAVTIDSTAAGVSIDAVTASNFTVSGAAADLTLGARGATVPLNEAGQTTLNGGFTATSIIGSINENYTSIAAVVTGLNRRDAVIDVVDCTAAPPTEVLGDRYILDNTVGAVHANWDGAAKADIVQFNGVTWDNTTPSEGWICYADTPDKDALCVDDGVLGWELRPIYSSLHADLTDVSIDQHHAKSHAHNGADGSGTVAHRDTTGQGIDDHHNKSHAHNGADGSGTVAHSDTTGQGKDDHHSEVHILDGPYHTGPLDPTKIEFSEIGTPTYDDLKDWFDTTQSAGIVAGGVITDAGSGKVDISAASGIIKTTNSEIGVNQWFDVAGIVGQALTDDATNYIAVDYNGGAPQIIVTLVNTADGHTIFNLGKVYRETAAIDIITSGLRIYDLNKRLQQQHQEEDALHFVSGAIVGEVGTREISVTAGIMYAGLNRIITDAIDTDVGGDTFEYYYNDAGGWQESNQTTIDNLQYNNVGVGLATLTNNHYGVHWVYKGTNATTFVVYGQDNYTLSEAQAVQPPASLPDHVEGFGVLRAKIIVKKSDAAFTEIQSVEDTTFTASTASNHNELANIQGGAANDYYHLTSANRILLIDHLTTLAEPHGTTEVVNAAADTFTATELCFLVTYTDTGACVITLSSAEIAKVGRRFKVKDAGLNCSVHNISVETEGAETIEGEVDAVMDIDGMSLELESDGSNLHVV